MEYYAIRRGGLYYDDITCDFNEFTPFALFTISQVTVVWEKQLWNDQLDGAEIVCIRLSEPEVVQLKEYADGIRRRDKGGAPKTE